MQIVHCCINEAWSKREEFQLVGDGPLQLKAGINKWQSIEVYDMQKEPELQDIEGANWWSVDLYFDDVRLYVHYSLSFPSILSTKLSCYFAKAGGTVQLFWLEELPLLSYVFCEIMSDIKMEKIYV